MYMINSKSPHKYSLNIIVLVLGGGVGETKKHEIYFYCLFSGGGGGLAKDFKVWRTASDDMKLTKHRMLLYIYIQSPAFPFCGIVSLYMLV